MIWLSWESPWLPLIFELLPGMPFIVRCDDFFSRCACGLKAIGSSYWSGCVSGLAGWTSIVGFTLLAFCCWDDFCSVSSGVLD